MDDRWLHVGASSYDFRYHYREKLGFDDLDRTNVALRGIEGKRLNSGA